MPAPQPVVVTGMGQVSSLGTALATFSARVLAGQPGVTRLPGLAAPGLADPIGAAIPDFDPEAWLPARLLPSVGRGAQYAHAAAVQAFAAAGLARDARRRAGVFVGTGFGGILETEETYRRCFDGTGQRPRPNSILLAMANAPAGFLASEFRLKGPNLTLSVACASATHAIGQAFRLLRAGEVDLMLAGGCDAPLTPIVLAAWNSMRVLAPAGADPRRACRPFGRDRQGIVIGEGAGFLVLETLVHARSRGASLLAEVVGYGANADAGHITHPDLDGITTCMRLALDDARLPHSAVDYVNAHGTGTAVNDRLEAQAIAALFGARPLVSSTKPVHGHAMGAAGGLEALATILALQEGLAPPTANLEQPDPALPPLDLVAGTARRARLEVAVSNSFAFGGNNAVIVLRRAG